MSDRLRTATAILCAMIANNGSDDVNEAVKLADALIEACKEPEPQPSLTAEQFLASTGYCDSRVYSATDLAPLMGAYARLARHQTRTFGDRTDAWEERVDAAKQPGYDGTNAQHNNCRIGLDKLVDQRNRIVAAEIPDPACSGMRDSIVLAFDILTQILVEHFPLMAESVGEEQPGYDIRRDVPVIPDLSYAACGLWVSPTFGGGISGHHCLYPKGHKGDCR